MWENTWKSLGPSKRSRHSGAGRAEGLGGVHLAMASASCSGGLPLKLRAAVAVRGQGGQPPDHCSEAESLFEARGETSRGWGGLPDSLGSGSLPPPLSDTPGAPQEALQGEQRPAFRRRGTTANPDTIRGKGQKFAGSPIAQ